MSLCVWGYVAGEEEFGAKSDKNYHAATPFQFRLIRAGRRK